MLLLPPCLVYAKELQVARDGSGDYGSITEALIAAQAGDSIYVMPGEYKESLLIKQNDISLRGAGFTKTKIIAKEGFPIKAKGVKGLKLEGLFIKAQTMQGYSAVLLSDTEAIIRHCLITSAPEGYGIFCNKGTKVSVIHNTLVGNQRDGGIRLDKTCQLTIKNNIIALNSFGINNKDVAGSTHISYNILWGNGENYVNCKPAEGNLIVDPRFINSAAGDYRLSPGSPCLKAGEKGSDIGAQEQLEPPSAKTEPGHKPEPAAKPQTDQPPKLKVTYELLGVNQQGQVRADEGASLKIKLKNEGGHELKGIKLESIPSSPGVKPSSLELESLKPHSEKTVKLDLAFDPQALTQTVKLKLQISNQEGYLPAPQEINFMLLSALTTGLLEIDSSPQQADIYLDGVHKGITPQTLTGIEPGGHKLKLMKGAFGREAEIQVEAGQKQNLSLELEQRYGILELDSQPQGAKVSIDGAIMGETPLTIPALDIGEHQLQLVKYTTGAVLQYKAIIPISPGTNRLEITQFTSIAPPEDMVCIPAGEFYMGSEQGASDEHPRHKVYLDYYCIDKYEVSNAQYNKFVQAATHKPAGWWKVQDFNRPKQPVVGVSWEDAAAYCKWAAKRLPTEAEWEKAARGMGDYIYPWGNKISDNCANNIVPGDGHQYAAPVGSYPAGASPYGVLDMSGNVAEWCADWYAPDYYRQSPEINPRGPADGKYRVVRGGSWNDPSYNMRTTNRWRYYPDLPRSYIGFRCVWQP